MTTWVDALAILESSRDRSLVKAPAVFFDTMWSPGWGAQLGHEIRKNRSAAHGGCAPARRGREGRPVDVHEKRPAGRSGGRHSPSRRARSTISAMGCTVGRANDSLLQIDGR